MAKFNLCDFLPSLDLLRVREDGLPVLSVSQIAFVVDCVAPQSKRLHDYSHTLCKALLEL